MNYKKNRIIFIYIFAMEVSSLHTENNDLNTDTLKLDATKLETQNMPLKLNLIVAVSENMGIGKNNKLPWRLKSEMHYFSTMTMKTADPTKKNVVIMGRKTWDSLPKSSKPLPNRINFVLSRSDLDLKNYSDTYAFKSLESCLEKLEDNSFQSGYETIWVVGGSYIYEEAMKSKNFYRLYLTKILKQFDCDTFFPALPTHLKKVIDPAVSEELQTENGINFTYNVYENTQFGV